MSDLSPFAADTNLLTHSTSRRLLQGVALEREQPLYVLPEVLLEVKRQIAAVEARRCERQLDAQGDARYPEGETRDRIVASVGRAATNWFMLELMREDTAFKLLEPTFEHMRQSRKFAMLIPPRAVRDGRIDYFEEGGDPVIIGEALAFGINLLSTRNFKSIDHEVINAWVTGELGRNSPLLYGPNETLEFLAGNNIGTYYQWMVTHGLNELHEVPELNHKAMYEVFRRISVSGFEKCAFRAEQEFDVDSMFEHKVEIARQSRHHGAAMQSERRLRQATRSAAQDAGWER